MLKKGDKTNFPKKGETVSCWYTGTLEDGTVFDTNIPAGMTDLHLNCVVYIIYEFVVTNTDSKMMSCPQCLVHHCSFLSTAARKKKQAKPLSFKVGMGKVIRGVSYFFCCCCLFCLHHLCCMSSLNLYFHSGMRPF